MGNYWKLIFLFVAAVFLVQFSSAEVIFHEGDTVIMENRNWINWEEKTVFKADQITEYGKTLGIGDKNITLYSSDPTNFTIYNYNLSEPSEGQRMLKVEAHSSSKDRSLGFTDLPSIETGRYSLYRGNTLDESFESGGEISWSNGGEKTNFSLEYENVSGTPEISLLLSETEIENGSAVKISCSASADSGIASTSVKIESPKTSFEGLKCGTEFSDTSVTGIYSVNFTARDNFGNSNTLIKSFESLASETGNSSEKSEGGETGENTQMKEESEGGSTGGNILDDNESQANLTDESEEYDTGQEENDSVENGEEETHQEAKLQAQKRIKKAEKAVDKGEPEYSKLVRAREVFDEGNYSEAERLASSILESDESISSEVPNIIQYAASILILLLLALSLYLFYQKIREKILTRKLEKLYDEVEKMAREGRLQNSDLVYRKLEEANKAFGENKYDELSDILKEIDKLKD